MPISASFLNGMLATNLMQPNSPYDVNDPKYQKALTIVGQAVIGGSFNFSNSPLGRAIGPNTPIEQIGNQQLVKELAYRAGSQLRHNLLPSIDVTKLFDGDPSNNSNLVSKPQYWQITKNPATTTSKVLEILFGATGNGNPFPLQGATNTDYFNNSGLGTLSRVEKNIEKNKYGPNIFINKAGEVSPTPTEQGYLTNYDSPPKSSLEASKIKDPLLVPLNNAPEKWDINTTTIRGGILDFTQKIVNQGDEIGTISSYINTDTQLFETHDDGSPKLSKGRLLKNDDGTLCRNWVKSNQYDSYGKAIRHEGNGYNNSVLNKNGMLRIAPNATQDFTGGKNLDLKNLMFSIENLAFVGNENFMDPSEHGPNDGRLMWFAPYDLTINESANANWSNVDFIGRNEPLYTYNGAERSATLGFKLIVDYPCKMDSLPNIDNNFEGWIAGCKISPTVVANSPATKDQIAVAKVNAQNPTQSKTVSAPTDLLYTQGTPYKVYFDNNSSEIKISLADNAPGTYNNLDIVSKTQQLANYLLTENGKKCTIKIIGYTSALNTVEANQVLGLARAEAYKDYLTDFLVNGDITNYEEPNGRWKVDSKGEENAVYKNSSASTITRDVVDRRIDIFLEFNPNLSKESKADPKDITVSQANIDNSKNIAEAEALARREASCNGAMKYFEELKNEDPFIFNKFSDKIKYFDPAFHSQTPQDFNTRLTFLHQCTRQGRLIFNPTTNNGINATEQPIKNSIFGRTPVCVLRVGDFFHTKIIIENIQFSYEPLIWDLNPEGVGVQPMICDITMSVKIIGGQSMEGPIAQLQNALNYNYYANTQLYKKDAKTSSSVEITAPQEQISVTQNTSDNTSQTNQIKISEESNTKQSYVGTLSTDGTSMSYLSVLNSDLTYLTNWFNQLSGYYLNAGGTNGIQLQGITSPDLIKPYLVDGVFDVNNYLTTINSSDITSKTNANFVRTQLVNSKNLFSGNFVGIEDVSINSKDSNKALTSGSEKSIFDGIVSAMNSLYSDISGFYNNGKQISDLNSSLKNISTSMSTLVDIPVTTI